MEELKFYLLQNYSFRQKKQLFYLLCRVLIITANWSEQTLHIDILETIPE